MAISKKPKRRKPDPAAEKSADDFIAGGGSVPGETETTTRRKRGGGSAQSKFTLRVGADLVDQMDEAVGHHPLITSRNTWIIHAIREQLKRERGA